MDNFYEEIIIKKNRSLNHFLYYLFSIGMILFGILALFTFGFRLINLILFAIFGAVAYGCFVSRNYQMVEYEYSFTNGELDIAKVIANSKRKEILSINVKEFDTVAPLTQENIQKLTSNPRVGKRYNAYLNKEGQKLYYGAFSKEGTKGILIFEPSEKLMEFIKLYNPRNVTI